MTWLRKFRKKHKEEKVPSPQPAMVTPVPPSIAQPPVPNNLAIAQPVEHRRFNGDAITNGLRAFNVWRDDFLIELSTLMLMAGFIVGTIDVFTSGNLYSVPIFNVGWAIIQAIAIDGLFFAVWGKIRRATWTWKSCFPNLMLIVVGLLLAIVATLVNGLLSYQELTKMDSIAQAMANMSIDQSTFTYARSILVVLVSILVALFAREDTSDQQKMSLKDATIAHLEGIAIGYGKQVQQQAIAIEKQKEVIDSLNQQLQGAIAQTSIAKRSTRKSYSPTTVVEQDSLAIDQQNLLGDTVDQDSQAMDSPNLESVENSGQAMTIQSGYGIAQNNGSSSGYSQESVAQNNGYIAQDDGQTLSIANEHGQTVTATGSFRDRIKGVMQQAIENNEKIDYPEIARRTGAKYGTVKKWAPQIREELEEEPTTEKLETVESSAV